MSSDRANSPEQIDNLVVLLSCVKSKQDHSCEAGEMYTSALFRKMMAYAKSLKPKRIFILSAKYGLLDPSDVIEPYEQTLKTMRTGERRIWAERVLLDLRKRARLNDDRFVFLAGSPYRENLVPHIKHVEVPMEGLAFGKQLQWLERQLR